MFVPTLVLTPEVITLAERAASGDAVAVQQLEDLFADSPEGINVRIFD